MTTETGSTQSILFNIIKMLIVLILLTCCLIATLRSKFVWAITLFGIISFILIIN